MAKEINLGELNHRIDIQEETASRGASGQEVLTWETLVCVWAKVVQPQTGNDELIDANQVIVTTRTDFIIRNRPGIDEKMRVVYNGSNYGILNIIGVGERNRFLTLQAHKVE